MPEGRFAASLHRTGRFLIPGAGGYTVPHAGPSWSGTVAAALDGTLRQQKPERIVRLAFRTAARGRRLGRVRGFHFASPSEFSMPERVLY